MEFVYMLLREHPAAVLGLLGTLGPAMGALGARVWEAYKEGRQLNVSTQLELREGARAQLERVVDHTSAVRAILVRVSNGGSPLADAEALFVTVITEAREAELASIRGRWQRVPMSPSFRSTVMEPLVAGRSHLVLVTEELPPGELLDQSRVTGVASTVVEVVHRAVDVMWYVAVHLPESWSAGADHRSAVQRDIIAEAVARLRPLVPRMRT